MILPKRHRETVFDLTTEEWQDSLALLQSVKAMLDQPAAELKRRGMAARDHAIAHFSTAHVAETLHTLLDALLHQRA